MRKMSKKLIVPTVSVLLVLLLASCGSKSTTTGAGNNVQAPSEAATVTESTAPEVLSEAESSAPEVLSEAESTEPEVLSEAESSQAESEAESEAEEETLPGVIGELKAVEKSDDFEVQITKKEIVPNTSLIVSVYGNDYCVFTVTNNSSTDITNISVYTVAYTEDYNMTKLSKDITTMDASAIQAFESNDDLKIPAGESEEIAIRCDASTFSGVRAIISSYKDADGKEHENSTANEWLNKAGGTKVLD